MQGLDRRTRAAGRALVLGVLAVLAAAAAPEPESPTWLTGFALTSALADEPYVYASVGDELQVLKAETAGGKVSATVVGRAPLKGLTFGLAVYAPAGQTPARRYLTAASYSDGLQVFDVTRPEAPRAVGFLPLAGQLPVVWTQGDLAFLPSYEGHLWIVSLADPTAPKLLADVTAGKSLMDGTGTGHTAYVLEDQAGLVPIDVTDPAKPVVGTPLKLESRPATVVADDDLLTLLVTTQGGDLLVVDVARPMSPVVLAKVHLPVAVEPQHPILVRDGQALVFGRQGIAPVDLRPDGRQPRVGKVVNPLGDRVDVRTASWLGGRVLVADGYHGLHFLEAEAAERPARCGEFAIAGFVCGLVSDGKQTLVNRVPDGLLLLPEAGWLLAEKAPPLKLVRLGGPSDLIALSGQYLVSAGFGKQALYVYPRAAIDAAGDAPIAPVSELPLPGNAELLVTEGSLLAARLEGNRVVLVDLAEPEHPRLIGQKKLEQRLAGVALAGQRLYLGMRTALIVVDTSTPALPEVYRIAMPATALTISIADGRLYAGTTRLGLVIYDLSTEPARRLGAAAVGIATDPGLLVGTNLLLPVSVPGQGHVELLALDVSDPAKPAVRRRWRLLTSAGGLCRVDDQHVLVAANALGLVTLP